MRGDKAAGVMGLPRERAEPCKTPQNVRGELRDKGEEPAARKLSSNGGTFTALH